MGGVNIGKDNSRHPFVFIGKGGEYLLICLMNFLLATTTLEIYGPWALIKCRRCIYQHATLEEQPSSYKETDGAIFVSMLPIVVVYLLSISCSVDRHFVLGLFLFVLSIYGIPCMVVRSLQYQASMTPLSGIRLDFNCSMMYVWWVMLEPPVLLVLVFWFALYLTVQAATSIGGLFFNLVVLDLLPAIGLDVVHGIVYSKWMPLLDGNATLGTRKFSTQVNVKECTEGCMLVILTMVPFIIVIGIMIASVFQQLITMTMLGGSGAGSGFVLQYYPQIMTFCFLYFVVILAFVSYLYATLRNLLSNNLTLTNGTICFHPPITAIGMFLRMLAILMGSSTTYGLAYPWLEMWMASWIVSNTRVQGDLDSLELINDDKPQDSGSLIWIFRDTMPYVPFI